MKITNSGLANTSVNGRDSAQAISSPLREGTPAATGPESDLYVPSQDWARFQGILRQQPEIRNDLVALAQDRVEAGYYLTAESAQQTASAMIQSAE